MGRALSPRSGKRKWPLVSLLLSEKQRKPLKKGVFIDFTASSSWPTNLRREKRSFSDETECYRELVMQISSSFNSWKFSCRILSGIDAGTSFGIYLVLLHFATKL